MMPNDDRATPFKKPTLLIVDDTPDSLNVMFALLKDNYIVKGANNGERALKIARAESRPDLILLDVVMPGMSGHDVCRELKRDPGTRDIPVIFLTSMNDIRDEQLGFELGAVDYITKPVSPPIVTARIKTHLENKAARDFLRDQNAFLEREIAARTQEIGAIQDVTIFAMGSLAETRDNETGNHVRRTQHYVRILAEGLVSHPRFSDYLTPYQIEMLFKSAPLHDIGKVGIPDHILLKPGKLEPDEFEIMKTHTTIGRDAITRAEQALGTSVPFLACAKEIAYSHQEKWDGTGYPEALAGDDIPVSARLMAVADVYDALISRRVYKPPFPHEKAVAIISEGRGSHFDPDIVDAFLERHEEFRSIAQRYADHD